MTRDTSSTQHAQADHVVVEISRCCLTRERQLYTATLGDTVLATRSRDPEPAAARALQRLGYGGTVQFRHPGEAVPYTRPQRVACLALTRHQENDIHGPRALRHEASPWPKAVPAQKAETICIWASLILPFTALSTLPLMGHVQGLL